MGVEPEWPLPHSVVIKYAMFPVPVIDLILLIVAERLYVYEFDRTLCFGIWII